MQQAFAMKSNQKKESTTKRWKTTQRKKNQIQRKMF